MQNTKDLFIKKKKIQKEFDNNLIELNFILALENIGILLIENNKKYEKLVEDILQELNNHIDFVLVKRAFVRFYNAIENLYKEPFGEKTNDCINYLLREFEFENIEEYLSPTLSINKKEEFIQNLKKFDSYKNFLHVFTKHFECYLRFYYESLNKKYYFCFENLYSVCYENKNVEEMNFDLINLCNKHCKSLEKYLKENNIKQKKDELKFDIKLNKNKRNFNVSKTIKNSEKLKKELEEFDELMPVVIKLFIDRQMASTSLIQRTFEISFARAIKIIEKLENMKFISKQNGTKPREVFIKIEDYNKIFKN